MELFFYAQVLLHCLGGGAGFLFDQQSESANRATHFLAVAAGAAGVVFSLAILLTGKPWIFELQGSLPVGPLRFVIDPFSAFFVLTISFLSFAASLFAVGYTREYQRKKNIALLGFFYHIFILAMLAVVTVQNAFYFLFFWELMSLASYFLVVFEHEKPEARSAGTLYLIMTHIGTAFIAAAFLLLYVHSGSFSFDAFRFAAATLSPAVKNAVFLAALIGFGTKAGVIPLHIWLPQAHPQAPSHVSALMSGVMIKTAIYAFLRFLFGFLGEPFAWWGHVVLALAILSTLLGILYALMENDLKRLLAFSSIENIGIILLGIGMALVFRVFHQPFNGGFALMAALFHVINHAAFKGLLFLGTGSVLHSAHTRQIENLGGLIRKMPWTAVCFLTGAMAISALPPLNGFVSEWLTFMALLLGFHGAGAGMPFFSPVLASLLGLAGALAATCFIKVFGISFLGKPRSEHAVQAREVSGSMKLGMGILAVSCLGLSLAAPQALKILAKIAGTLAGTDIPVETVTQRIFLISPLNSSLFSPLAVALVLLALLAVIMALPRIIFGKKLVRTGPSWDCGMPALSSRMQYTATGFSKPLRRIFSFLYQPTRRVELEDEGHEMLRTAQRFEARITHPVDEWVYRPLAALVSELSQKAKRIQTGHIQLYLSYIFITLILLLLFLGGHSS
ncbi:MAG TPA: hydrogenase 4 subunit B [Candidatus Omnitrophota bacterium]|nr:hydrogenase 4 subunit B [Candidatus Omnitrophota bacterium]HRY85885.1 hydrogenase 4 subunit B [Candidatus Omnitrophota bacterium]